jgi:hypothetical protein
VGIGIGPERHLKSGDSTRNRRAHHVGAVSFDRGRLLVEVERTRAQLREVVLRSDRKLLELGARLCEIVAATGDLARKVGFALIAAEIGFLALAVLGFRQRAAAPQLLACLELLLAERRKSDLRCSLPLQLFDLFAHPRNLRGKALPIELRVVLRQLYLCSNFHLAAGDDFERRGIRKAAALRRLFDKNGEERLAFGDNLIFRNIELCHGAGVAGVN